MRSSAPRADAGAAPPAWPERQFYGRQKARPLRPQQLDRVARLLPGLLLDVTQPSPEPLSRLFPVPVEEIALEIGFGGGEHLAYQAARSPKTGFIGIEPFVNGVASLLAHIEERSLANVRIFDREAAPLLAWLPPASISRAYVLFPDPWPKARHRKRRLISAPTLARLARVLRPGAELCVATDIGDYARTTLLALAEVPQFLWPARSAADWRERGAGSPETRYERKAASAGRRRYYFRFTRA